MNNLEKINISDFDLDAESITENNLTDINGGGDWLHLIPEGSDYYMLPTTGTEICGRSY